MQTNPVFETVFKSVRLCQIIIPVACVASVSVRLRSKKLGTRVKDHAKNGASKRAGRGWGRKEEKKCFLGFSVWHKNLATSGYALANIHWVLDTELTLAWLCAVSYEKSEVKIYFSKRHIWSRTFEESIRIILRETSFKRDNFFATYNRNFRGGSALHLKKKILLPEGLIRTCLLAVHQPAVLHSKLLWCVLFRKHTSLFFTQNAFLDVIFVAEIGTKQKPKTNKTFLRGMWLLVLKFTNMTPYLTEKCCFWLPSRNSCLFANCSYVERGALILLATCVVLTFLRSITKNKNEQKW